MNSKPSRSRPFYRPALSAALAVSFFLLAFLALRRLAFPPRPLLFACYTFLCRPDEADADPRRDLRFWLSLPAEGPGQRKLRTVSLLPDPDETHGDECGNEIAYWDFAGLAGESTVMVEYSFTFCPEPVRVPPDTNAPAVYDEGDPEVAQNLRSERYVTLTKELRAVGGRFRAEQKKAWFRALAAFDWTITRMRFAFPVPERGTEALSRAVALDEEGEPYLQGDHFSFASLFVALCRAAGIPARVVSGYLVVPGMEAPHAWAEFLLPDGTWVPADPTLAQPDVFARSRKDLEIEGTPMFYFGGHEGKRVAFCRGTGMRLYPPCPFDLPDGKIENGRVSWMNPSAWRSDLLPGTEYFENVPKEQAPGIYRDRRYGLEVVLPLTCRPFLVSRKGAALAVNFLHAEAGPPDISLDVCPLPRALARYRAAQYGEKEVAALKRVFPEYAIVRKGPWRSKGMEGWQVLASAVDNRRLQFFQIRTYFLKNGNAYVFWADSLTRDPGEFRLAFDAFLRRVEIGAAKP